MSQEMTDQKKDEPLLRIVQSLKEGSLSGKSLDKDTRLEVIEFLRLEGTSVAGIAQILGVSDRTIRRDSEEARKKNALRLQAAFPAEMAGELMRKGAQHWQALKAIARSPSASTDQKIMAERVAWEVELGLCRELRELGFLPSAPKALVGQFSHQVNVEANDSWDEALKQYTQLKELVAAREGVVDAEIKQALDELEPAIEEGIKRQRVQEKLNKVEQQIEENDHANKSCS